MTTTATLRPTDVHPRDLAKKALELAEASPDFVYTDAGSGCVYVEEDVNGELVGSCLFGQAFLALGVDPATLVEDNNTGIEALLGIDIATTGFGSAQGCQDVGIAWGSEVILNNLRDAIDQNA